MSLADRLRLFEPMLDDLMSTFGVDPDPGLEDDDDPVSAAYRRCEVKRLRLGRACEADPEGVGRHADALLRAIVHDHCPSGDRQLVEPLAAVLGGQEVTERVLDRLERGPAVERLGAAMAYYWSSMSRHDPPGEEARAAYETRYRHACLRAFVASDDPADSLYFSFHFTLDPAGYPDALRGEVEAATRIARAHPDRYRGGEATGS
ncbi:hypothetical protein [Nonomuraea sp. NPDC048826]|uniref:hypothetical protein n=1 Tax=Nonomuraea sp. NPDC048826 TaxID=3364347 RepID=UPI003714C6E1